MGYCVPLVSKAYLVVVVVVVDLGWVLEETSRRLKEINYKERLMSHET